MGDITPFFRVTCYKRTENKRRAFTLLSLVPLPLHPPPPFRPLFPTLCFVFSSLATSSPCSVASNIQKSASQQLEIRRFEAFIARDSAPSSPLSRKLQNGLAPFLWIAATEHLALVHFLPSLPPPLPFHAAQWKNATDPASTATARCPRTSRRQVRCLPPKTWQ